MLANFLKLLIRRWRLSVTFVVLALAAAGSVLVLVPPTQESQASVLFIPPSRDASVDGTLNPFLSLSGSLGVVPTVIQATVSDKRTADRLLSEGHDGEYTVAVDLGQNAAPILEVTVDSKSAATSVSTTNAVVAEIQNQLKALQAGRAVDSRYLITATVLTSTPEPLVIRTGQIQAAALAAVGVLGLGLGLIGLTSRPWGRAAHRRSAGQPAIATAVGGDGPGGPGGGSGGRGDGPHEPDGSGGSGERVPFAGDSVIEWSATTTHRTSAIDPSSLPTIGAQPTTSGLETPATEVRTTERAVPTAYRARRPGRAGVTPRRQHSRSAPSAPDMHRGGSGRGFGDGGA